MRGYIFDLDGVIVDTAKYHYLGWKRLADELGLHFSEQDNELLKGVSRIRSFEIILELNGREKLSVWLNCAMPWSSSAMRTAQTVCIWLNCAEPAENRLSSFPGQRIWIPGGWTARFSSASRPALRCRRGS